MSTLDFSTICHSLQRWTVIGERRLSDGTWLIGRVPHIAPEAWLHEVFGALPASDITSLESQLNRQLPGDLQALYREANGLRLFSGTISIFGLRRNYQRIGDAVWQPFDLVVPNLYERPKGAPVSDIIIGSYGHDGSMLAISSEGEVALTNRDVWAPRLKWESLDALLLYEVRRLAPLYNEDGKLRTRNSNQLQQVGHSALPPSAV